MGHSAASFSARKDAHPKRPFVANGQLMIIRVLTILYPTFDSFSVPAPDIPNLYILRWTPFPPSAGSAQPGRN